MKKFTVLAVTVVTLMLIFSNQADAQFKNRGVYLGPNLTLATDPIGFGADIEFAVSPNFGIGGLVRYWGRSVSSYGYSWSWTIIVPQAQAAYHFMPGNQLDPYVGARLGYAIYSESGTVYAAQSLKSDVFLNGCGGLRYFFNPGISLHGSLEFRIGGTDYFGGSIGFVAGVDFTL